MRLKHWHRTTRRWMGHALGRAIGTTAAQGSLMGCHPASILVVRLNNRLGNTLLLSPFLLALARRFPAARIDLLLRNAGAAELLRGLPGVHTVWVMDQTIVKNPWRIARLLARIRAHTYDLLIDPAEHSSSNRFASLLLRARQRLGFAAPHQWMRLDIAECRAAHARHEGLYPLLLLGIDARVGDEHYLQVRLPDAEARAASGDRNPPRLGFVAVATGAKQYERRQWQSFIEQVRVRRPDLQLSQFLALGERGGVLDEIETRDARSPGQYARMLRDIDVFVAADGGPMHLAAACGVPTVGLFQATDPLCYAPLGRACVALQLPPDDPAVVSAVVSRLPAAT